MREVLEGRLMALEEGRFEALREEWRAPAQVCLGLRDMASRAQVGGWVGGWVGGVQAGR